MKIMTTENQVSGKTFVLMNILLLLIVIYQ